jgi:hypothetical protein
MPEGAKAGSAPPFRAAAKWARPALVSTLEGRYNCESSGMCLRERARAMGTCPEFPASLPLV